MLRGMLRGEEARSLRAAWRAAWRGGAEARRRGGGGTPAWRLLAHGGERGGHVAEGIERGRAAPARGAAARASLGPVQWEACAGTLRRRGLGGEEAAACAGKLAELEWARGAGAGSRSWDRLGIRSPGGPFGPRHFLFPSCSAAGAEALVHQPHGAESADARLRVQGNGAGPGGRQKSSPRVDDAKRGLVRKDHKVRAARADFGRVERRARRREGDYIGIQTGERLSWRSWLRIALVY